MLVGGAGGQEQGLQAWADTPVDQGHLVLGVEVRHAADPPDDGAGPVVPGEVRQQSGPELSLHVGQVRHGGPDHLELFLGGEHLVPLFRVGADADKDRVKASGGPPDHVQMAQGDGVEAAGADGCSHGWFPRSIRFPPGGRG